MSLTKEHDVYEIKKFDDTNFALWKNQIQDVLIQKKQKLPITHADRIEDMNLTQFQWQEMDELCEVLSLTKLVICLPNYLGF